MILSIIILFSVILGVYILMQTVYALGWIAIPVRTKGSEIKNPDITVLIAFRNESKYLGLCIQGILNQKYPSENLNILLLNDHSDDDSVKSIASYLQYRNVRLINMPEHVQGKKPSIAYGLKEVQSPYVLFTDADCIAGPDWISSMVENIISSKADAICGSVEIRDESNLLSEFQALDFAGMMGITAVSMRFKWYYLANGANLLVRMNALDLNNISWQEEYASGDDMSLIAHLQKKNAKINFAKDKSAIVSTIAQSNLSDFFRQRLRWGTKNKSSKSWLMLAQLGLAYLVSILSLACIIGLFFDPIFIFITLLKIAGDAILLTAVSPFFRKQAYLIKIPLFSIMHSTYIAVIGTLSLLPLRYQWKGRIVK